MEKGEVPLKKDSLTLFFDLGNVKNSETGLLSINIIM